MFSTFLKSAVHRSIMFSLLLGATAAFARPEARYISAQPMESTAPVGPLTTVAFTSLPPLSLAPADRPPTGPSRPKRSSASRSTSA